MLFRSPAPGVETSGTSPPAPPKAEGEKPAWKVDDTHGPSHPVNVDTREGTWMSVSVHGDKVLFDLLGDIWSIPLAGGEATRVTSGNAWDAQPAFSPDGTRIAFVSDRGGNEQIWIMNADGSGARQFTDEAEARVTEPRWDGDWIVARRRTVDTRSIGVTELWQYHLEGGSGIQLTKLDNHPHAGEAVVAGRYLWYSDRSGRFEYNHDPLGGLWSVWKLDRVTGEEHPVVSGVGSASRPMLAPDQKSLVFVSRDRDRAQLEVLDLASGKRRILFTELDRDEMEGFAMHGTYPAMDWTSDGKLVLWAKGKLWKLGLDGTKTEIPFHAAGSWNFRDVHRWDRAIPDEVQAKVIRWPTFGPDGSVVFSAMGALWRQAPGAAIERLSPGTGYAPTWSADGTQLLWTSWSDTDGGRLHLTKMGKKRSDEVLPVEEIGRAHV